jgi:hypothetical protein
MATLGARPVSALLTTETYVITMQELVIHTIQ